ncbi:MAG TPA: hypothetical protein VGE18_02125 [Candidatus Paceibacterota bacterium]
MNFFNRYKWSKYLLAFLLTSGIFGGAVFLSSYITERKLQNIRDLQDRVATDILSSETQLDLIKDLSCEDVGNTYLSKEIANLAERITYTEENGTSAADSLELKKQYSILEVKDFVISKQIAERCNNLPVTILYFYTDKNVCPDCVKQGYVLDALRNKYDDVRIYSFDSNLDLTTIKTLKTVYGINDQLPALVIDGVTVNGFKSLAEITAVLPSAITNPAPKTPVTPQN